MWIPLPLTNVLVWWEWLSFTGWLGLVISLAMRPTIHIAPSEENFWAFQDTCLPLHYDYSCKLLRGRLSLALDSHLVSFIVGWLVWYWELDPEPWACQAEPLYIWATSPTLGSPLYAIDAQHPTELATNWRFLFWQPTEYLGSNAQQQKGGNMSWNCLLMDLQQGATLFGITCWAVWHLKGL